MQVFWRKGYEGASLPDLTAAMGINRPSLYAAFGDKQALFRKALDRYAEGPAAYVQDALTEPTARAVAERIFRGDHRSPGRPAQPAGLPAGAGRDDLPRRQRVDPPQAHRAPGRGRGCHSSPLRASADGRRFVRACELGRSRPVHRHDHSGDGDPVSGWRRPQRIATRRQPGPASLAEMN